MSQKARTEYVRRQVENAVAVGGLASNQITFEYTEDGFKMFLNGASKFYPWQDIIEIAAYKVDLLTVDDLRLDIAFADTVLTISEDLAGFPIFIENLHKNIPDIDANWETKVLKPPFETNYSVIYRKHKGQ